ncbi:23S rRNA (adenine(1618)-N(6))-methyltransferase RlmF [uncultured Cyclobacterium sp.]|uniref:23S rRNA (adenine(1618)-N(6))-methyltransferase RlmF n=1 Tax=uncultured Cyclobacterium sp. TaxID=453820 RepID=UPI0030EECE3D|tara:strand:+ start:415 stop:1365 length:951 start_codon:yes stop_codon:yes gene_type:complete
MTSPNQDKGRLHPRNKNLKRYDIDALAKVVPALKNHLTSSKKGNLTIDFSNPAAIKLLNKAILNHYYDISYWEFPEENLCPPIPGRADYLHHMADLLGNSNEGKIPMGDKINCLDIGVGASCIYPILGITSYEWHFTGTDIDPKSIASSQNIVNKNAILTNKIALELQENSRAIFHGIIRSEDKYDLTICNPPFHSSSAEAQKGNLRKVKNLSGKKAKTPHLNFSGTSQELIVEGGELKFIQQMINESQRFQNNVFWFSSLVSKQSNLKSIYKTLEKVGAKMYKTIPMGTSNKSGRIVAWTFLSARAQNDWVNSRW